MNSAAENQAAGLPAEVLTTVLIQFVFSTLSSHILPREQQIGLTVPRSTFNALHVMYGTYDEATVSGKPSGTT